MADLPTIITSAGLQPQPPASILAQLLTAVAATNPGYTANLPGSLIEDISSTDVASIVLCDQARVELVNSLTPLGANDFLLAQLGAIYGVQQGAPTFTSVFVTFTGPPGFIVTPGFTVSDGSFQYTVEDGGVIGSDMNSDPLFCVATVPGSWVVPAGTVTQLVTSVPSSISLSCNNLSAGTPGTGAESAASYRARVLQAGQAIAQGMATFLKTLLSEVEGVQPRLISVLRTDGKWEVICGGGDPYKVAFAIYEGVLDITTLVGSTMNVTGITKANPGVVTTDKNHGYADGQACEIDGATGMTAINGVPLTATVLTEKTFSCGVDTSGFSTYTGNGVLTPNLRNIEVSLQDYPDTYLVEFVNPPEQDVAIGVTWNTTATNFVSADAVAQLGAPALVDYVNALPVGVPMNLFELQAVFQAAIAPILPPQLLTRMVFSVSINGIGTPPSSGTGIIAGDPESYFLTAATSITITQG